MAELGVFASALTVIAAGFNIAKGLNTLADGLGSAGEAVRMYASEIRVFSELLDTVREILENNPGESRSRAEHLTMDILDISKRLLDPVDKLKAKLDPLLVSYSTSPTKLYQLRLRIQWVFHAEQKLKRYRGSLKALTVTLTAALATVKLAVSDSDITNQYKQENLAQCMDNVRRSLQNPTQLALGGFLQPTIYLLPTSDVRATIMNGSSLSSVVPSPVIQIPRRITFPAESIPQISDADTKSDQEEDDQSSTADAAGASQAVIRPELQEEESIEGLELPDSQDFIEIDQTVYEAMDQALHQEPHGSEQELWEDLRHVSRKVLQYAEEVLDGASKTTPNDLAPSLDLQPVALPKNTTNDPNLVDLSTDHGHVSFRTGPGDNFDIVSTAEQFSVSRIGRDPKAAPDGHSVKTPVTFRNFDGKSYTAPIHAVQDWEDAKSFLLSLSSPGLVFSRDGGQELSLAEVFSEREFHLKGPDGHYIVPQYWAENVQPGSSVELSLSDNISWRPKQSRSSRVRSFVRRRRLGLGF